jgi:uncharacterized membrane protein (GlpM family)
MEFALKVVASFVVGGGYVALITYIAEHINPRLGGVLAGLPSTALISLIFIALTQNQGAAISAIKGIPAGFGFTTLFVALYVNLRHASSIQTALLKASAAWIVLAVILTAFVPRSLLLASLIFIICFVIAIWQLEKVKVETSIKSMISNQELITRAMAAGLLIAIAVIFAKLAGAFIGGVIASFPVVVGSSLTILDYERGRNLMSATAQTIPYGSFGNTAFVIVFGGLVPHFGLASGTVIAYAASVVAAVIALQARIMVKQS